MQLDEHALLPIMECGQWCAECGIRVCRDSDWWCSEDCFYDWQRVRGAPKG